jgi:hypothetical protein
LGDFQTFRHGYYRAGNRNSPVAIATGYGLDDRGSIPARSKILLFSLASRPALEPTQSPIQWEPGEYFAVGKAAGLEADHSSLSSSKVKNVGRGNFTFIIGTECQDVDWINLAEVKNAVELSCEHSNNLTIAVFCDVTPCILVKKTKVKLSLDLIKHHYVKKYGGVEV